jgi:hypothetical protein
MSAFEARTHIGRDRKLELQLPSEFEGSDVSVRVEKASNGTVYPDRASRSAALRRLAGSIDDPTFVRPPQGEFETREPLD